MENININHALNPYLDSTNYSARQLILPLDCGVLIEKNDSIHSFCEILEGVNLKAYLKPNGKGRHDYEDLTLIKIVLFAYMSQILSLRDIESACRCDIRFMWLAQGIRPSHMTFQRLINESLNPSLLISIEFSSKKIRFKPMSCISMERSLKRMRRRIVLCGKDRCLSFKLSFI